MRSGNVNTLLPKIPDVRLSTVGAEWWGDEIEWTEWRRQQSNDECRSVQLLSVS
jgi:hypothetical protein